MERPDVLAGLILWSGLAAAVPAPYRTLGDSIDTLPLYAREKNQLRLNGGESLAEAREFLARALIRESYPFSRARAQAVRAAIRSWDATDPILSEAELDFADALGRRRLGYRARNILVDHDVRTLAQLDAAIRSIEHSHPQTTDALVVGALEQLKEFAACAEALARE